MCNFSYWFILKAFLKCQKALKDLKKLTYRHKDRWETCSLNLEAPKVQFLYWAGMAWIMMILDSNCENLRQGAILLLWNVMKNRRALGTTAKMWGFFYEYEVVTTTCVAAGVFTTMCGVYSGVNLCLKADLIKGDCIFTQHELLTNFFFTYL